MIAVTRPENQWPAEAFIRSIAWAVEHELNQLPEASRTQELSRQMTIEAMNSVFEFAGPAGNA